jgi:type IV pilus assembly protein PilF
MKNYVGVLSVVVVTLLASACAENQRRDDVLPRNPATQTRPENQTASFDPRTAQANRAESARIRAELAFNYFQRGQMAVALEEINTAIASDPSFGGAYNVLGLINMDLGRAQQAEEAFKKALSLTPGDSDTLNNYGWFLCRNKRERESIGMFMNALKNPLYETPVKPYLNAGICSQQMNDIPSAEDYFRKAFNLDPGNATAMYRLGELYLRVNNLDQARFYSERLNRAFEPSAESLWLLVRIERRSGNAASEASYATQLRRRFPNSREGLALQQGRYE